MRLSWNEVRARAARFAEEWKNAAYEKGETQTFYNEFFEIFDVRRRRVANYEQQVAKLDNRTGFIDLFWPGVLIVEQKSAGRDLEKARKQALDYCLGVRESEHPRYLLVSDFQNFELYDLEEREEARFALAELPRHVEKFGFILGVQKRTFKDQDPVNLIASNLMAEIHDALKASGYGGHELELYLVRLLFCLFADDTGIFEPRDIFLDLLRQRTAEDGSDLGPWLAQLFEVLNKPEDSRQKNLDQDLAAFPYVNGDLFAERLSIAAFDSKMREKLIAAAEFNWDAISPAIFGSLFQAVLNPKERRAKGAHYTTEKNILKVIGPLFLDDLRAEFERLKARKDNRRRSELEKFHQRLGAMKFFDPACGCGNFLVIAYRELRRLEIEILKELYGEIFNRPGFTSAKHEFNVASLSKLNVDQFYGIEIDEFPARIAETALWMMDHIMNNRLSLEFGEAYARIPLKTSPHIHNADALEMDWNDVLPARECSFVFGNPPFGGAKYQTPAQRKQVREIARLGGSGGTLDYVAAWFVKAGDYAKGAPSSFVTGAKRPPQDEGAAPSSEAFTLRSDAAHRVAKGEGPRIGFVATNSITQGEQVAQLWPILFERCGLEIAFAHRTFAWGSDARGKAHVHVVVIGLVRRADEPAEKRLFSYDDINGDPVESRHKALSPYLFDASGLANRHLVVRETTANLSRAPKISFGNMPNDGGFLMLNEDEKAKILQTAPPAKSYIRRLVGAHDVINGERRYCLWLMDVTPKHLREYRAIMSRLEAVRKYRLASNRKTTRELANTPQLFGEIRQGIGPFILVPRHSSERRDYIPITVFRSGEIAHDSCLFVIGDPLETFATLTSAMHMAWLRSVGGRLESRYRYSIGLVYNTFPWPDATDAQKEKLRKLAQAVLDARAQYPDSTLADLYDPDVMPAPLRRAHHALDLAVDKLYRSKPFASDRERAEHLFALYEKLAAPLEAAAKAKPKRRRKRAAR